MWTLSSAGLCRSSFLLPLLPLYSSGIIQKLPLSVQKLILSHLNNVSMHLTVQIECKVVLLLDTLTCDPWLSVCKVRLWLSWRLRIQRENPLFTGFLEKKQWSTSQSTKTPVLSGFDSSSTVRYEANTNSAYTCKLQKQIFCKKKEKSQHLRAILKMADGMQIITWWKGSECTVFWRRWKGLLSGILKSVFSSLDGCANFMLMSSSFPNRPSQRCRLSSTWVTFRR